MSQREQFDERRAEHYAPRADLEKVAILADISDEEATTVINTAFGVQTMRGPFYLVAADEGSYGAAKAEFEHANRQISPNTWVKHAGVDAYRTDAEVEIATVIGGHTEGVVLASRGDWIVRQTSGEVMALKDEDFAARYETER